MDPLVAMPLSLVCKQIGNMQAIWAAGHLAFSPARACYQQLYSIALRLNIAWQYCVPGL